MRRRRLGIFVKKLVLKMPEELSTLGLVEVCPCFDDVMRSCCARLVGGGGSGGCDGGGEGVLVGCLVEVLPEACLDGTGDVIA